MTQLRQELGQRIIEAVFDPQTDKPSKVLSQHWKLMISLTFDVCSESIQ